MQDEVTALLRSINSEFYQTFGQSFADTRGRLQPGVVGLLDELPQSANVLDLGCGHGQIARWRLVRGDSGLYCGVDSSPPLLALTDDLASQDNIAFTHLDLAEPDWSTGLKQEVEWVPSEGFDWVFAFAVMHHLPGEITRQRFVQQAVEFLGPHGRMAVSNWNFMASPRLQERILTWETIDLEAKQVEAGDYLLDWRRDGQGLRYIHHFDQAELSSLAEAAGLRVIDTFFSDGETGNLGLYQVWAL
jgi:SAM-dependent methyltransferase